MSFVLIKPEFRQFDTSCIRLGTRTSDFNNHDKATITWNRPNGRTMRAWQYVAMVMSECSIMFRHVQKPWKDWKFIKNLNAMATDAECHAKWSRLLKYRDKMLSCLFCRLFCCLLFYPFFACYSPVASLAESVWFMLLLWCIFFLSPIPSA